jgi:predicted phage terminase large subunit-like protein
MDQAAIQRLIKIELAKRSFWEFCKLISPDFYKENRPHLKIICDTLQKLYENSLFLPCGKLTKKLIMNIPPQHGKSRTLFNFADWIFGKNPNEKIITCSYNDSTASDFSRYTRDGIMVTKNEENDIIYSDIFPKTRMKYGQSSFEKWALEGQHFSYLGAGIGGSITSKGGSVLIVDDAVKDAKEAMSETILENTWRWYTSTFRSRVSAIDGEPIEIINMTRWSVNDLCGKLLADPNQANEWFVLKMEAYDEKTDTMLCPELLSKKRYMEQKDLVAPEIFAANYHQEPFEAKGIMFPVNELNYFTPTKILDEAFETSIGYIDVADEGNDYTCMPIGRSVGNKVYIVDVVCNKQNTDITLPQCEAMLKKYGVKYCRVETNSMGGMYMKELRKVATGTMVLGLTSTANKHTRILMEAGNINKNFYFLSPEEQSDEYKTFMRYICAYKKEGKTLVDDAADALSGLSLFIREMFKHLY